MRWSPSPLLVALFAAPLMLASSTALAAGPEACSLISAKSCQYVVSSGGCEAQCIPEPVSSDSARRHWDKNFDLLMATVEMQDFPTCEGMQRGFASGMQDSIVFGRNEPALQHYHRNIAAAVAAARPAMAAE